MLVVAHTNRSIDIFGATGFQLSQQPRIAGRRAHEAVLAPALQYPGRGDLLRSGARHRHQQRVQISRRETALQRLPRPRRNDARDSSFGRDPGRLAFHRARLSASVHGRQAVSHPTSRHSRPHPPTERHHE
jgi:hypothetical protein